MALPASPPITLDQVRAEFGAPVGTPLASFLRGGAYVPNTGPNAGVPTALPISLLQLLGATAASSLSATATNVARNDFLNEPAPSTRSVSGGSVVSASGGSGSYTYSWAYLSGDAGISCTPTSSPIGINATFNATVNKNTQRTASWRVTINDGVTSIFRDVSVSLQYTTDL